MALPKQVLQQQKELEELEKQLMAPSQEAANEETETELSTEPRKAEAPEVKPTQPVATEVPEETWQQKYRTLEGKYSAEVPRLHAQLKELQAQIAEMREKPKEPEAPKETKPQKLVTDADVEAFGSDLIEVQRKVAREVAMEYMKEIENLKIANEDLRKQITQTGSQIGAVSFETRLAQAIPDFEQINADPKWIAWLDEVDPILRGPRRNAAQEAFNRGDVEALRDYMALFKGQAAPPKENKRQAELERQIQPTKSNASTPPPSQKGKTYSTAEVEKMFRKVAELGKKGSFEEAKKLEAEIDAAFLEGRVTT
jgi:hypothetical protein